MKLGAVYAGFMELVVSGLVEVRSRHKMCRIFCHILKERLATVVEEYRLVVEEQGGFRRGRGCRDQIVFH